VTLAERMYRMVLWLYPARHRQAYGGPMLQHARDLGLAARQRGPWHVALLCPRLLKDGIVNAAVEHMEVIGMTDKRYTPVPWLSVMLAALPGLLAAVSRRQTALLDSLLPILGYLYLGLVVLASPIIWWKRRRFPVWALLPSGILIWSLTYMAGSVLSRQVGSPHIFGLQWTGIGTWITLIHLVLATVLFVVLLRGRRIPSYAWVAFGIIVLSNALMAVFYSLARYDGTELLSGMVQYFTASDLGPIEGLMLVAVGLLAARQHGVLASLVVVGGYSYMCLDSDYLFGHSLREWVGLSAYLAAVTVSFLVVVPVALLRAKTPLGRALAVFVPTVIFHVARLTIPPLVMQEQVKVRPGEIILSINVVLSLALAWALYSHVGDTSRDAQPSGSMETSPLLN
jgi:hypothetical protein